MMNFPEKIESFLSGAVVAQPRPLRIKRKKSRFHGVSVAHANKKWEAVAFIRGEKIRITTFAEEAQAAEMSDWLKFSNGIFSPLNFPISKYQAANYSPPKTISESRLLPKFITAYISTNGKARYRVRDDARQIKGCFASLEEAKEFLEHHS